MMHEEDQERRFQEMKEAIEKFILDSKREIDHVESRMIQGINKEQQRVSKEIETIGLKLEKRVDELAIYHNALKDENDRLSDRLQGNTSEIVQFQK
jgi:guanylate kinase